ncbi:hypothetical protein [Chondromyces apiculatus]|uniref:Exopolysaccharide biosynthesis domain protein n=1 Tax=Chondromyces apiculatus DSM 436 TaxID=1192034 RepID=A0A017THQ1_9BACT|nr:hypothetical protein [Chondromyces apiculatus]EYF08427.1 exopolysaccharide biosynthesis domain protein [Chondromyces apiculatus DSM 436]
MRLLGARTGLTVFRWDLVYLCAQLEADGRAEIGGLAASVGALLQQMRDEREAFELAEDAAVVARARRARRGVTLDRVLIAMGGVARATDRALYAALFPRRNPSKTARLAPAEELQEVARMLGELDVRPAEHPVRVAYQARLAAAQAALRAALEDEAEADTQLALARMRRVRFKRSLDEARLVVHGRLLALLRDKAEAGAFFRPTTKPPGSEAEKRAQEAAAQKARAEAEKAAQGKRTEKVRAGGEAPSQGEAAEETRAEVEAPSQAEVVAQVAPVPSAVLSLHPGMALTGAGGWQARHASRLPPLFLCRSAAPRLRDRLLRRRMQGRPAAGAERALN